MLCLKGSVESSQWLDVCISSDLRKTQRDTEMGQANTLLLQCECCLLPVRPPRPLWPLHPLPSKVLSSDHCLLEKNEEAVKQDAGSVRMNYTWRFF